MEVTLDRKEERAVERSAQRPKEHDILELYNGGWRESIGLVSFEYAEGL